MSPPWRRFKHSGVKSGRQGVVMVDGGSRKGKLSELFSQCKNNKTRVWVSGYSFTGRRVFWFLIRSTVRCQSLHLTIFMVHCHSHSESIAESGHIMDDKITCGCRRMMKDKGQKCNNRSIIHIKMCLLLETCTSQGRVVKHADKLLLSISVSPSTNPHSLTSRLLYCMYQ